MFYFFLPNSQVIEHTIVKVEKDSNTLKGIHIYSAPEILGNLTTAIFRVEL